MAKAPPTRWWRPASGLAVVSDEGALIAAVDAAIAANPDVAARIRDGKLPAVGVLVGAVMKATRGQADAARVRALILERLASRELARQRRSAPGAGAGVQRATQLAGPVRPRSRHRTDRALSLTVRCPGHQDGDQGRDLFRRRVTAYHAQQRLAGWLIVVSGAGHHGPFGIKDL